MGRIFKKSHKTLGALNLILVVILFLLAPLAALEIAAWHYSSSFSPEPKPAQKIIAEVPANPQTPTPKPQEQVLGISALKTAYASTNSSLEVPILMYHYISYNSNPKDTVRTALSVNPDKLNAQLNHLAQSGYHTITLDNLYAALNKQTALPSKPIILSFDDGYIDFYTNAFPILEKYHMKATSFIPTGLMNRGYYLHWDQIKQMSDSGLISFEAHSVHHLDLATLSGKALNYELIQSKRDLEQHLGKPVNFMAYPSGKSNASVRQAVATDGYLGSAGTWYSKTQSMGNILNMPRVRIGGSMDIKAFDKLFP